MEPGQDEFPEAMYSLGAIYSRAGQNQPEIQAYERLTDVTPKDNPYRISGLSRQAELYIAAGDAKKAAAIYRDVAANAKDETALANAKSRLEELQKVLEN